MFGEWVGFEVAREPLYDPDGREDPLVTGRLDPAPSSGRSGRRGPRRGTDAELRGLAGRRPRGLRRGRHGSPGRTSGATSRSTTKPDRTFVTQADTAIERLIRERIGDAFPDHGLVGEEYGDGGGDAPVRWYIDPIDGTHNFIRGVPLFGTLLAVERDGELQAGSCRRRRSTSAGGRWRGGGAWARSRGGQPRRIRVSRVAALDDAQVLYGSAATSRLGARARLRRLLRDVWRERGFGDFWGYALVAEGAAEAMVEVDLCRGTRPRRCCSSRRPAAA